MNFVILFWDGSTIWISDEVYAELMFLEKGEKFTIEKQVYDYSDVKKILDREHYEAQYPANRLPIYPVLDKYLPAPRTNYKHALECTLEGITGTSETSEELRKMVKNKLYDLERNNIKQNAT